MGKYKFAIYQRVVFNEKAAKYKRNKTGKIVDYHAYSSYPYLVQIDQPREDVPKFTFSRASEIDADPVDKIYEKLQQSVKKK